VRNPGPTAWAKLASLKDKYAMSSKDRLQKELNTNMEKWHAYSLIESGYSLSIKDFVFVNVDNEEKLAIIVLGQDSIRKIYDLNSDRLVSPFPKTEKF